MRYSVLFFIAICFLCGCKRNSVIQSIHEDVIENSASAVNIADYTDFDWDRALLFNAYLLSVCNSEKRDSIETKLSFRLNSLPLTKYELTAPLIFMKGDEIVHIEINYEETFPDDDNRRKKEKIAIAHSSHIIDEIDRNKCVFSTDTTRYGMNRTIMLYKILPNKKKKGFW
jgi:hypothetical protein